MNTPALNVQTVVQDSLEPEKGYIPNKGLPEFVPKTEIRRLRTVIDQKNAAIEAFKEYDEERKQYIHQLEDDKKFLENELAKYMKKKEPLFASELKKLLEAGDMTATEYEKFMKLYAYWLQHRNDVIFYKSRLKTGRSSVKDLKKDLKAIKEVLSHVSDMELLDRLSDKMLAMTAHLDTLQQRLSSFENDDVP